MAEEADGASDSRSSTPQIPPGVVPSPSEEKLYNMMWRKAEESNESDVVRDVASSERESRHLSSTEPDPFELSRSESRMSPTIKGTPQRAWSDTEQSPLAKTIYVRSANEDLSDEDGKEVGVSTTSQSQPKGRSTRRVTPIGHEISRPRRKEMERRVKNVIGTRENDDPELLKFREISSPERDKESEHSGVTDGHPVTSTPKPATIEEEEDHLYDDVFTEDEMTFVEKDWHVPGILDFSDYSKSELTPLHYAASLGKRRYLLELINAIRSQREPVFNLLTPDGKKHMLGDNSRISHSTMTDINCLDGGGRTALMHAVHWNRLDCARLMIYEGADINLAMPDGTTCLHQAAYSSDSDLVNLLLHHRADTEARDSEGRCPLHWAANNSSSKVLSTFLDKVPDLDVNVPDSAGMSSLMWAAYSRIEENVKLLLNRNADASLTDIDGMAAVHWAVQQNNLPCLKLLLTRHSSKIKDSKGKTIMHFAAEQGAHDCIDFILSVRETALEDQDNENRTPLHWAAACDQPDTIQVLLSKGANVNALDSQERSAYDYAMLKEFVYCALLLSKQNAGKRPMTNSDPRLEKIMKGLAAGCWMAKFTNKGHGPLCKRLFWVNFSNGKICWSSVAKPANKDIKSAVLVDMRSSPSPVVMSRKDFDPLVKHQWAFSVLTPSRVINLVAYAESDYRFWTEGLQTILTIGMENISNPTQPTH